MSDEWDAVLISELNDEELVELILGCNFLDIKSLLDVCLVKYACEFKDVSIDEVKTKFNIEEEFTPEVEERLKQEYHWAMEIDADDS